VITFALPGVLAGLVAAAVPILLHLVARREPPTVSFPAVRYLEDTARRHQRRLNLQHWLLLVVRTALIVALVLAAAGPTRAGVGPGGHAPAALVLVLDNSLSAGAIREGEPMFESLREAARSLLQRATAADELWLITADGIPRRGGPAALSAQVDSLTPVPRRLDLGQAVVTARELLRTARHPGEVVVLSDLQASALSPAPGSEVVLVGVPGEPPPANLGIASIVTGPQPWSGSGRVTVSVGGRSDREVPLTIGIDGRTLRQALVQPDGPATAQVSGLPPGWHAIEAHLDPDELRLDDAAHAAVRVAPPSGVNWIPGDRYLDAAAEVLIANGRLVAGSEVSLGHLGPRASVVLPPADPAALGALNRSLAARGAGWQFGALEQPTAARLDSAEWVAPFEVRRRYRLEPIGGEARGVLLTVAGEPWLVRGGDLVLVASRFDPEWTHLPVAAAFLPFLDALVNRIARGELERLTGAPGTAVRLPDQVQAVASPTGEQQVEGGAPYTPQGRGLHWLLTGSDTVGVLEVNADPRESDLARGTEAAVEALWPGARLMSPERAAELAFSQAARADLRAPLLWLALILAVLDFLLGGGWRRARG